MVVFWKKREVNVTDSRQEQKRMGGLVFIAPIQTMAQIIADGTAVYWYFFLF